MAKLSAFFDAFDNLDQIPLDLISRWVKPKINNIQLENYIANKILYPKTLPISEYEMQIDLAILREALRINGPKLKDAKDSLLGNNAFLNINLRKILIPDKFLKFVPNLQTLVMVFLDGLLLGKNREDFYEDLWTIVLTDDVDEVVGSAILPRIDNKEAQIELNINNQSFKIKAGTLMVIPCALERCPISYKLKGAYALGKDEGSLEIYGGKLGVVVDARLKNVNN